MQPFVSADASAYQPLLNSMPDPLKIIQQQIAFKTGIESQQVDNQFKQAQMGAQQSKVQRQQQFATAMQGYLGNPTAEGLASLMGAFPEFSEEAKVAYQALDKNKRTSDLTQMGEIATLVRGGNVGKATELMRARVMADKEAGDNDQTDDLILEALESGDPARVKQAQGLLAYGIGIAVGPEHAKSFLGATDLSQEPDLIAAGPGVDILDKRNIGAGPVYSSPYKPTTITDPATGQVFQMVPKGGGATTAAPAGPLPGGTPMPQSVGATLASSGWAAPVIAGFLGNFHVEGGLGGAKGDGGTAHGLAQWRGERVTNFQRVIGKAPTQATPEEQARFVMWEMQNPQAAGMTVKQRDAILAAKTPEQAAILIDKFYERSDGKHRSRRVEAARGYASGKAPVTGGPIKVASKQQYDALSAGQQYIHPNDGSLRVKG